MTRASAFSIADWYFLWSVMASIDTYWFQSASHCKYIFWEMIFAANSFYVPSGNSTSYTLVSSIGFECDFPIWLPLIPSFLRLTVVVWWFFLKGSRTLTLRYKSKCSSPKSSWSGIYSTPPQWSSWYKSWWDVLISSSTGKSSSFAILPSFPATHRSNFSCRRLWDGSDFSSSVSPLSVDR